MKKIIFTLIVISLLIGCSKPQVQETYIIQESEFNTYIIEHKTGYTELKETELKATKTRKINNELRDINEEVDDCIGKITENWVRIIDDKLIRGYDEKLDWEFRLNLKAKAMKGEKAC